MFGLFTKKERYNIDGREVIIQDKSDKTIDTSPLQEAILDVCTNVPAAYHFSCLTFIIETTADAPLGWSLHDDLKKRKNIIHLNTHILSQTDETPEEIVIHELAHLWHELKTRENLRRVKAIETLNSRLFWRHFKKPSTFQNEANLKDLRLFLMNFFNKIYREGFAEYYRYHITERLLFTKDTLLQWHTTALNETRQLNDIFTHHLQKRETDSITDLIRFLSAPEYSVGLHMIFTILYVDHTLTIEDVASMGLFPFIRTYERCIAAAQLQPVVSLTSGKGILDYKRMTAEIVLLARKDRIDIQKVI